ncbi:type VI secretion system protein TssA [Delftia tsuruhatensis]|uniref:type VI secretion system protein TssA n=1 Tax=Delftia tsuruhatensis TaxID=180282 RepID=UPI002279E2AF|nr:type VI secretion system protein TssA [Delftia tsuruhatensis]
MSWSTPISPDAPSGADMEYESIFAELETAAIATPEQQYGDTVIAGKGPDWQQVLTLATTLSTQTKDLRVLVLLTRALTHLHGLQGTLYGLRSAHTVLDQFWDSVHPQLTIDGEDDPQMRFNALSEFGAIDGLGADMRQSAALTSHLGVFSVKDLDRLWDTGATEINGINVNRLQLKQIVDDISESNNSVALRLPRLIVEQLDAMLVLCQHHLGSEFQPDYGMLKRPLQRLAMLFEGRQDVAAGASPVPSGSQAVETVPQAGLASTGIPLGLASRKDAIHCLELACQYIENSEPTNPAPLLIRRAIKLMEMNFMDIIKHLAPDGLNQAMFITGAEASEEDGN